MSADELLRNYNSLRSELEKRIDERLVEITQPRKTRTSQIASVVAFMTAAATIAVTLVPIVVAQRDVHSQLSKRAEELAEKAKTLADQATNNAAGIVEERLTGEAGLMGRIIRSQIDEFSTAMRDFGDVKTSIDHLRADLDIVQEILEPEGNDEFLGSLSTLRETLLRDGGSDALKTGELKADIQQLAGRIDQIPYVLCGNITTSGIPEGTGKRAFTTPIDFNELFAEAPQVALGIKYIDSPSNSLRISVEPTKITKDGFVAEVYTWNSNSIRRVELSYVVVGKRATVNT